MRRLLAVLLVLAFLAPTATAVPDVRLAISDVSVAPETPVVAEPVTVTATVRDSAGSPSPVNLTSVRLVAGDRTLTEASNPGALSQGETLTIDLTHRFASAGTKELAVVATGTNETGAPVDVRRPVTVVVEHAPPQIELTVARTVATADAAVQVRVSNPNTAQYRNLTVTLDTPGETNERATIPVLAGGATVARNLSFTPREAGDVRVRVGVRYTTNTGIPRSTSYGETVTIEPLREDVGVAVSPVEAQAGTDVATDGVQGLLDGGRTLQQSVGDQGDSGAPDAVTVEVTNFGNAPLRDAVVVPAAGAHDLPRRYVGQLAPGESATVEVSLDAVRSPANVTARVEYATGDRTGMAVAAYDYRPPEGAVRVTGVGLSLDDGMLRLSGNAGNVGDGTVTGVVIAVGENQHVSPSYPQRDYFIGTVEGSEFAPFELTADVDAANATTVPIEVTYRTDGEARTETFELPFDRSLTDSDDGGRDRLGLGLAAGLGLALLAVAAMVVVRRYR